MWSRLFSFERHRDECARDCEQGELLRVAISNWPEHSAETEDNGEDYEEDVKVVRHALLTNMRWLIH